MNDKLVAFAQLTLELAIVLLACWLLVCVLLCGCRTVNNYQISVVVDGKARAEQTTEAAQGKEVPIEADVTGVPGL